MYRYYTQGGVLHGTINCGLMRGISKIQVFAEISPGGIFTCHYCGHKARHLSELEFQTVQMRKLGFIDRIRLLFS